MKSMVKERSIFSFYFFSIITLGIYAIVFWHKLGKDVDTLCEGDGKKTMKYVPAWLLSIITLTVMNFVWMSKLAKRLNENAERYGLRFSESGGTIVACMLLCAPAYPAVIIKNFNKMAKAYNDYNGLEDPEADKKVNLFADDEEEEEVLEA